MPLLERQRVEHAVQLRRVHGVEPRMQQELPEGGAWITRSLDQELDRATIGHVRLELEEAENGHRMVVAEPRQLGRDERVDLWCAGQRPNLIGIESEGC